MARRLAIVGDLCRILAIFAATALGLVLIDRLWDLPPLVRSVLGPALSVGLLASMALAIARRRRASLGPVALAYRLEGLTPAAAGWLASTLDLARAAEAESAAAGRVDSEADDVAGHDPARRAALARRAEAEAVAYWRSAPLWRLLNGAWAMRRAALAGVALLAGLGLALGFPVQAEVAAARWATPWSAEAVWPKRVALEPVGTPEVVARDAPAPLGVRVTRGLSDGLRVEAVYRWITLDASGQRTTSSMRRQRMTAEREGGAVFRAWVEPRGAREGRPWRREGDAGPGATWLELWYAAGDAVTEPMRIRLAARPRVTSATLTITPPAYATPPREVVSQPVAFDAGSGAELVLRGLAGSEVRGVLRFDRGLPMSAEAAASWLTPGRGDGAAAPAESWSVKPLEPGPAGWRGAEIRFVLDRAWVLAPTLRDADGLASAASTRVRLEPEPDAKPWVRLAEPASDVAITPEAVLPLRGEARDDLGVASMAIRMSREGASPGAGETGDADDAARATLASRRWVASERSTSATVEATFDAAAWDLSEGDVLTLRATARDAAPGEARRSVSPAVRLTVVGPESVLESTRRQLSALRERAAGLAREQDALAEATASRESTEADVGAQARSGQRRLAEAVEALRRGAAARRDQLERNRLSETPAGSMLSRAVERLAEAAEAAEAASEALERESTGAAARRESAADAEAAQREAARSLRRLAGELGGADDALALELAVRELLDAQSELRGEARRLLPETVGRDREQLAEATGEALDRAASRQERLAGEAGSMLERAASQGESESSESTAGLREAAESARREGLEPAMRDAAEALRRGRVAEAARAQAEAMRLLERMREAAQPNEAARQAVLRRAAADLLARVRELVERQGGLIDRTRAGGGETELASALRALRAATLSASEAARELESRVDPGAAASPLLTEAGRLQGEATVSIATSDRDGSVSHQRDSLESLQSAASRLAARREAAADDEAEAERRAWAERYRELASAQQATAEATASAAEAGAGRVAWLKLATRQAALREPTATLGEQAGADSPVVALLHEQLDRWMEQSTVRLRAGEGGEATRSVQLETAARLLAMAESYEQPRVDQPFARSPRSGGGEGGGAAGGGEAPRTPPLQELRLLRSAQASLMDRWSAGAAGVGQALSEEQLELAEAARELAARMAGDGSSGGEGEAPGAEGDGGDL